MATTLAAKDATRSTAATSDSWTSSPSPDRPHAAQTTDTNMQEPTAAPDTPLQSMLGAATSNLAKFKAEQDLSIQTENLSERPPLDPNSSASGFPPSNSDSTAPPATPKTPLPPPSSGKKRRRRTAAQIDRKFSCNYPGCNKAYGSEGSLTQHQRLKHRQQQPETPVGSHSNQLGNFFLPLHRSSRNMSSTILRPTNPNLARTVSIRPATMEGVLTQLSYDVPPEFRMNTPPMAEPTQRQNARVRSNSMPISFSSPPSSAGKFQPSCLSTPRPQSTRKGGRVSSTPRSKTGARRIKCRSKSESLSEMDPFIGIDEFKSTSQSDRKIMSAGNGRSSMHEAVMPVVSSPVDHSLDWRGSDSTPPSSNDQAIDSDILSVLADCDSPDMTSLEYVAGPPSNMSYRSAGSYGESEDQEMLSMEMDCFKISGISSPLDDNFYPSIDGAHCVDEDIEMMYDIKESWPSSTRQDALYLSTHMEKMTMAQATSHDSGTSSFDSLDDPPSENNDLRDIISNQTLDDPLLSEHDQFSLMPIESFPVKDEPNGLSPELLAHVSSGELLAHVSSGINDRVGWNQSPEDLPDTTMTKAEYQMLWTKDFGSGPFQQNDLDSGSGFIDSTAQPVASRETHEWKSQHLFTPTPAHEFTEEVTCLDNWSIEDRAIIEPYSDGSHNAEQARYIVREQMSDRSDRGSRDNSKDPPDAPLARPVQRSDVQQRLHESFQDDRRYLSQMVGEEADKRSKRIAAILELKDSIDASSTKIQAQNTIMHRRAQEITDKEARAYQDLLNQGMNPHEVSRRRHVKKAAEHERKLIEARIQDKQVNILQHLEVEKVIQRRRSKLERERLAFEKKYQQEMGSSAVEERTKNYLVSRTGKEQLDPTGKLVRVYPSQETTIKDYSFGLGKNAVHSPAHRERIVAKIHAKPSHRNTSANPLLLPRPNQSMNQTEVRTDNLQSILNETPVLSTPGQEVCDMNHSQVSSGGSSLLPPIRPSRPNSGDHEERESSQKKGFGKPKRSVMEQQMFANALEKHKSNIFQKQIVWGKEFKGDAFLCNPPLIWFKDYDVGKPQTVTFTLTNVSNTFNHFKFLDLDDAIRDCFEIVYEKPGRMSAGTSCSIRMSYTALKAVDIETHIPAVAQTGPFQIPLRCSCKKAVPVLNQQAIIFEGVVAGEIKTVTLTLANQGALPMEYFVRLCGQETTPEDEFEYDPCIDVRSMQNPEPNNAIEEVSGNSNDDASSSEVPGEMIPDEIADDLLTNEEFISNEIIDIVSSDPVADLESIGTQMLPLSTEEIGIVQYAKSCTVYKREGSDNPIRFTKRGIVPPYSSSPVSFTFAPSEAVRPENQRFFLDFTAAQPDGKPCHIPSIPLSITAQALEVPIFMNQSVLDFRCCVYGKLYRHQALICNRSKVALKIQLRVPKLLEDIVDFHPNVGFVQAATLGTPGKFVIQVKFRPQESIWKRIERKGFGRKDTGMMMVPIQVVVPDQVIPVYFFLMARLSSGELLLSSDRLDFGSCALGHSLFHILTLENKSRVPQRVGFVKVPPDVWIEDDGNMLLPNEKHEVKIIYQPKNISTMQSKLVLRTSFNQEYVLPCTGNCVTSPLLFSHTVVHVGATQLGQSQIVSITCSNCSETTQDIEFVPPPEASGLLRVMPLVARIEAKSMLRVEFEFTPSEKLFESHCEDCNGSAEPLQEGSTIQQPQDDDGTSRQVQHPPVRIVTNRSKTEQTPGIPVLTSSRSQSASTENTRPLWETGVPAEQRSCHHTWTVLCFRKAESSTSSTLGQPLQALQVQTTAIDAKILVSPPQLNFGQVAIGQTLILELELSSSYKSEVTFEAKALHALGSFRIINSLRPLAAADGPSRKLKVEFRPQLPLVYQDELELHSHSVSPIRIPLRGEGINPSLSIQPSGGLVDFKDVLARNRSIQEIVLTNASAFPLTFSIRALPSTYDKTKLKQQGEVESNTVFTSSGAPAFTILPSEGTIPAQGALTLKAIFLPDHQKPDHYLQQFRIVVPNESEHHVVTLSGRCWENQLFVFYPQSAPGTASAPASPLQLAPPVEDLFDLPPQFGLNLLSGAFGSLLSSSTLRKSVSTIMISFDDKEALAVETVSNRSFFIGSTMSPMGQSEEEVANNSAASGSAKSATPSSSFELTLDESSITHSKLFTIEPMKGSLSAGQSLPVQVTYQRPPKPSASQEREMESNTIVVSQWIQIRVICTLRGGFLWRPLPSFSAGAAPVVPTPASGGQPASKTAPATAAAAAAATKSTGNETESRVVHLVLRARLDT